MIKSQMSITDSIDAIIDEMVKAKVENFDFDDAIDNYLCNNTMIDKAAEKAIESAVEEYKFEDDIRDAMEDYNLDRAVETAVEEAGIEEKVEMAIDEILPKKLESALFALLERPEVAERLVRMLFDKAE